MEYLKVFDEHEYHSSYAETINIDLTDAQILRLIPTEKPDLVQIIFKQDSEPTSMFVLTWDLTRNLEYSMA